MSIIEALIFASGHGLSIEKIIDSLKSDYSEQDVLEAIKNLKNTYGGERGIILIEVNKTLQFQSNPKYGVILSDILKETRERELSKTLLQVLAIIAYKQPVTKAEIEELRGVNSDYVVSMLLNLGLIDGIGRKETVGRPILYGTTVEFLRKFGISSINDLPDYEGLLNKIKNNHDKYYPKTDELYRDPTTGSTQVQKAVIKDSSDALPDFLKDEDIIEVE
ncbi:MAG TPA: SMC-Scp complex subunit ScpB [Clostridia bacterium]|jgi:segregation and condensation protein B|nr:SMC-Scp complex subunit ScpB [Clostridia bacterium]